MTDVANLVLAVDATQVEAGAKSLDVLSTSGERAEASARKLSTASGTLHDTIARQNAQMAGASDAARLTGTALEQSAQAAQKLIDKYDPLGSKLRQLQADFSALDKAAMSGAIGASSDASADRAMLNLQKEIGAAQLAMNGFVPGAVAGMGQVAAAAEKGAFATAGAKRELIVLAHEAVQGNFSRMPGSFMVLAERMSITSALFNPFTGAILALGAAAYVMGEAFSKGAEEMHQMENAMKSTSDFAGMTRGSMRDLAQEISTGNKLTIGEGKAVVTELVASGRIGAESIAGIADLVARYAKATGQSAEEATPKLIKLFSDPVKGAETLNQTMHFLSVEEMNHIRALEEMGKTTEAQRALSEALDKQLGLQVEHVGALSYAWNNLKKSASSAWDSMMGMGREKTVEERLAIMRGKVDKLSVQAPGSKEYLDALAEMNRLASQQQQAATAATAKAETAAKIDEANKANKLILSYSLEAKREELRKRIALMQKHPEIPNQSDAIAQAKKQLADIGKSSATKDDSYARAMANMEKAGQDATFAVLKDGIKRQMAEVDAGFAQRKMTEGEYYRQKEALERQLANADVQRIQAQIQAEQAALGKTSNPTRQVEIKTKIIELNKQLATSEDAVAKVQRDHETRVAQSDIRLQSYATSLEKANQAKEYELSLMGMDSNVRAVLMEQYRVQADLTAKLNAEKEKGNEISAQTLERLQADVDKSKELSQKMADAQKWSNVWQSVERSAHDAFINIYNTGSNTWQRLTDSLRATLLDLLYQMTVKKWVLDITAQVQSSIGGGSVNVSGGGFGSMFGSLANNVSTAFEYGTNIGSEQTSMLSAQLDGMRAGGGPVNANGTYLVGEKGPELLRMGNQSGSVVPNNALGSNVTINVIESPGQGGQQKTRDDGNGGKIIDVFVEQVKSAIAGDIARGRGPIPAAMNTVYGLNRVAGAY